MTRESFKFLTTRNVGTLDRILRAGLLPLILLLYSRGYLPTPLALGLGVLASMLLLTALTGSCSIYYLFGYSSCPIAKKREAKNHV